MDEDTNARLEALEFISLFTIMAYGAQWEGCGVDAFNLAPRMAELASRAGFSVPEGAAWKHVERLATRSCDLRLKRQNAEI